MFFTLSSGWVRSNVAFDSNSPPNSPGPDLSSGLVSSTMGWGLRDDCYEPVPS